MVLNTWQRPPGKKSLGTVYVSPLSLFDNQASRGTEAKKPFQRKPLYIRSSNDTINEEMPGFSSQ